jgi:hypothetical protein
LLIIGPTPFFHSPQPRIDFSYYEISGPDICSLICDYRSFNYRKPYHGKFYQSCSKIQIPKITQDAKITVSLQLCCCKVRPTEIRLIYNYGQKYIIDKNASKYLQFGSPTRAKNISILKRNAYTD